MRFAGGSGGGATTPGIPFVEGDAAGLQRALASGRPVLVEFSAEWCAICGELDRTTFREPEVVREAERFVALKVDVDRNGDLVARYGVLGPPTILLFPSGSAAAARQLMGAVTPEELVQALREIR
jgi:thiol:disulfide interchange protein DsbD